MVQNRWIRTTWKDASGNTIHGHAGRRGYIMPATKEDKAMYVGITYDGTERLLSSSVSDLKKLLDSQDSE